MGVDLRHGGNRQAVADVLGCRPSQLLDASASLAPWSPRCPRLTAASLRDYPDRDQASLRQAIASIHGHDPASRSTIKLSAWLESGAPSSTVSNSNSGAGMGRGSRW